MYIYIYIFIYIQLYTYNYKYSYIHIVIYVLYIYIYIYIYNYILEPTKINPIGGVKDKIMSLFKTGATQDYSKATLVKNAYGGGKKERKLKTQKQSEDKITKSIRNLSKLKKENEAIKDRIIRDTETLLEKEDNYTQVVKIIFEAIVILNMKVR